MALHRVYHSVCPNDLPDMRQFLLTAPQEPRHSVCPFLIFWEKIKLFLGRTKVYAFQVLFRRIFRLCLLFPQMAQILPKS